MILTKSILAAQTYALKKHQHQIYGDDIPYSVHLFLVVSFAQQFARLYFKGENLECVIIACWLHDVREDLGVSYNEIKNLFGEEVAEIVYGVTNEDGRTREEKAIKTYPKTAKNRLSVFVKLADRLANTYYSKLNGSRMFKTYAKEYEYFYKILHVPGEYDAMWDYLKFIINEYKPEENII